ncbi:MAG: penicillin-binding protein [Oscillospiraceae bacterium]|nr:penicillin-binding protein [Oscillospiraceae bacterium]MBQ9837991.1 penicillin-binding protein [Oscillospiraceae bacterium]
MNRIAGRTFIAMLLVFALLGGTVFFLSEYFAKGEEWVLFSGSPHVYGGTKLSTGMILDRDGALLLDLSGDKTYAPDASLRKAMLHWTGDRQGNVYTPILSEYTPDMVGYDAFNGVYSYANEPGRMTLTLSSKAQKAALEAMGERVGTVAVYNYRTGELLCAVTTPNFDPDNVPDIAGDTSGSYEGVYLNRFTQSVYIPGSIFKIATLAAALETRRDMEDMRFTCDGVYEIGSGDVTCEKIHGKQDLKSAFSNSCNCAFAQIVELVGRDKLQQYVEQFAVTESVSFDGITTAQGNFDVSNAYGESLAWAGIGQYTDQINPCSFMGFMGAIANGGKGVSPYVVSTVQVGSHRTYRAKAADNRRVMSGATAQILTEYLRNNVEVKYGAENFPGLTVCAKTGTGEVGGGRKPNAMFAGFVEDEAYPYAFIVAVEDGGYGSSVCIPIISKVLKVLCQ